MYVPHVLSLDKYKHSIQVSTVVSKPGFHVYRQWPHLGDTENTQFSRVGA
jgi:hypothetical protein